MRCLSRALPVRRRGGYGSVVPLDFDVVGNEAEEPAAAADPGGAVLAGGVADGDVVDGLAWVAAQEERAAGEEVALHGEDGEAVLGGPLLDDGFGACAGPD